MSGLYANYKALAMGGGVGNTIDLTEAGTDIIRAGISNETDYTTADAYVSELATDQDWADVGVYGLNTCYNTEPTIVLDTKTTTDGVFNAADITFVGVTTTGQDVSVLLHYLATGVEANDSLICLHDGFTPVTPNGGDIVVVYNGLGIFEF